MSIGIEIGILALLILFNGFLSMSELAVVSARDARLKSLAEGGSRAAKRVLALKANAGRFLSAVQIGITLVGVLAGAFSGATLGLRFAAVLETVGPLAPYAEEIALGTVVTVITYFSLIVGELVPKQIALSDPERVAMVVVGPMSAVAALASPLVSLLDASSDAVLRILRIKARDSAMTEDEIKAALRESTAAGVLEHGEQEMMQAVMRFADRRVRSLMTPRPEVVWLDLDAPATEIAAKIRATPHSRYPVCRGDVDNVIGLAQAKDILDRYLDGEEPQFEDLVRPVDTVPDSARALDVLDRIKRSPIHMVVVADEYGAVDGIVTAADILSDLVGGLAEHGEHLEAQAVRRPDGSWLIDGDMDPERAGDLVGLKRLGEGEDYATLAGFMLDRFGTLPEAGDSFDFGGMRFEVADMDGRRIDKVLVTPLPANQDSAEGAA